MAWHYSDMEYLHMLSDEDLEAIREMSDDERTAAIDRWLAQLDVLGRKFSGGDVGMQADHTLESVLIAESISLGADWRYRITRRSLLVERYFRCL